MTAAPSPEAQRVAREWMQEWTRRGSLAWPSFEDFLAARLAPILDERDAAREGEREAVEADAIHQKRNGQRLARLAEQRDAAEAALRGVTGMRLFVECYRGRAFDRPQLLEIIEHAEAVVADADAREKGGGNGE